MIVKKPYGVLPCLGGNDMTFSHIRNVHKNFAFICSLSLELVVHAFLDITYRHHLTLRHTETFCAGLYLEMFLLHFHSHFWVELDVLKIQFIILSMVKGVFSCVNNIHCYLIQSFKNTNLSNVNFEVEWDKTDELKTLYDLMLIVIML